MVKNGSLNVSSSSSNEQNGDLSISKEEESSKCVELIDTENMKNTENAVASEIEVDHKTNLLQFSEDEICEHYANLATHIIAAFSNESKSEECVKRLKTILKLLEENKDEVLKCKAGNDNSEKGDIVEAECKETERVEAERKETERVAEHTKEAEMVKAESTETETVEAECKTEDLYKENEGKSKKSVSFTKSVECNMKTVPEDNLDDTLELNETNKDSEQQLDFKPSFFKQIEKHVAKTIEEIRSICVCTKTDGGEKGDSDSLVTDDQIYSTPPCSQMACHYGKTR